ncbi:hypothetical protein [Mesorhizobium sp. ES1-1]|uniref:hypothetical protein n=1 Tax=Mesorhizobium sp. ES1-1 TaxID=2876629 RepID=UPI001CCAF9E3|nr:hypothetical protein [Mesorhizobium sp. ES1-1]MBZ9678088.1 hypothetical protein [Mesorhizobium sp. ES1-1]
MEEWTFADPPNVAVLSDEGIFRSGDWIAYVVHEADDDDSFNDEGGSWQFHGSDARNKDEREIMVVALQTVVRLDESIRRWWICRKAGTPGAAPPRPPAAGQVATCPLQRQRMIDRA